MGFVVPGVTTHQAEELFILLTEVMYLFLVLPTSWLCFWLELSRIHSLYILCKTSQQLIGSERILIHRELAERTMEDFFSFPNQMDALQAEVVPTVNGDRIL